jgi:internalin A
VQREFLNIFRRDQAVIDTSCPNVFTLQPVGAIRTLTGTHGKRLRDEWLAQEIELQLYCQAPGSWHPTLDGGKYRIKDFAEWITTLTPYLSRLLSILKYSAKVKSGLLVDIKFKDYIGFIESLADQKNDFPTELGTLPGEPARGADLRAVHALLDSVDPTHKWGELDKVLTPEGHYLWLCKEHAAEYRR